MASGRIEVGDVDDLVDRFVARINSENREFLFADELTPSVSECGEEAAGSPGWRIRAHEAAWIAPFESRLPAPLPASFRSLVGRYIFPAFEVEPLWLFGNTPEGLPFRMHELRFGVFGDELLSSCLMANGYIQFARPAGGSYDPICFNTRRTAMRGEFVIERLDHEEILCNSRIHVLEKVVDSFYDFMLDRLEKAEDR